MEAAEEQRWKPMRRLRRKTRKPEEEQEEKKVGTERKRQIDKQRETVGRVCVWQERSRRDTGRAKSKKIKAKQRELELK